MPILQKNVRETNSEISKHFILKKLYTADDTTIVFKDFKGSIKEFARYMKAFAYPATLYLNDEGKTIFKAIGYRNIQEQLANMYYVSTSSYKRVKFDEFKDKWEFERDD
jgi:thioredoxin-related protein